jgi:hypothetical protein
MSAMKLGFGPSPFLFGLKRYLYSKLSGSAFPLYVVSATKNPLNHSIMLPIKTIYCRKRIIEGFRMGKFIGLGILIVSLFSAVIVIFLILKWSFKFIANYLKYGGNPKPWLKRKDWVNKKIIWNGRVRGSLVLVLFVLVILPILIALMVSIYSSSTTNFIQIIITLMILMPIFGYFMYSWLQFKKFGRSTCYLETLPGEIGGIFEAKVEIYFPNEHPKDVNLILRLMAFRNFFDRFPVIWEKEKIIRKEELEYVSQNKYIVPVQFDIPRDVPLQKYKNSWLLILKINSPGINYLSDFHVPIFDIKNRAAITP